MQAQTLLIIEDDLRLAALVRLSLEAAGYQTCLAMTGAEGLRQLAQQPIALVLLDQELPDGRGIDFCRQIHAQWQGPVIFFSAEQNVETKIQALEAGARDYIVKPVDVRELLARVKVQLREPAPAQPVFGSLRYEPEQELFYEGATPMVLSELEQNLLLAFFQQAPGLVSKAELYRRVWGGDYQPERDAHLVEAHVSRLRARLKQSLTACKIQTVYGKGYFLSV